MIETVFQLWYLINNDTKYPIGHEFTSNVLATDLEEAEVQFKKWFKDNNWNTKWLKIKDYKNDIEKSYTNS